MRIVFMGTPDFSVPALESLVKANHEIIGVVTQPDKPKDRGHEVKFTPVKEKAIELGIENIFQPFKVKDESFVKTLTELRPDVIVVVAFGQLLSKEILELPKYGCINIHASLLPKYRGAAPIQWAVIDGEQSSGVTTMHMAEGLDTGDIIEKTEIMLDEKETGGSLHDKLSVLGGELIVSTLVKLEEGTEFRQAQNEADSSYARKLDKNLGNIDFKKSALEIERLIRGLNPWPSAYTYINGKVLKIWKADVIISDEVCQPGVVKEIEKNMFIVGTGENLLGIKEVQLQGKKRMSTEDFLRGNSIVKGIKLGDD